MLIRMMVRTFGMGFIVGVIFLPAIANAQYISYIPTQFGWPIATPCSLKNDYGQYQHPDPPDYYMHDAVDILGDTLTYVTAIEEGEVAVCANSGIGDPLDWKLAVGTNLIGENEGWVYVHLKGDSLFLKKWNHLPHYIPVNRGDTLGLIRKDHVHLERAHGYLLYPDSAQWANSYPFQNPLNILDPAGLAQRQPPSFNGKWLVRDSTERALGALKFKHIGPDSFYIVNRKIDVEALSWYKIGPDELGVYKIVYSIKGSGTQGLKGFIFSGRVENALTDTAAVMTRAIFDTSKSVGTLGCYIISNTDSMNNHFEYGNLSHLKGYWNTIQHKNKKWYDPHDADSNAVARFKDGWCTVLLQAEDERGNAVQDSFRVIINNFPPKISRTFPSRSWPLYPESQRCTLKVWFDQPMDTMSALGFHLYLKNRAQVIPGKTWFPNGNDTLMFFFPDSAFQNDTVYYFKQDSALTKDIADSLMTRCYVDTFQTGSKQVHTSEGFSTSGSLDSCWVEVRGSNLHSRFPRVRYAVDTLHPFLDSLVFNQKITFDTSGNRYVGFGTSLGGVRRIVKFNSLGDTEVSFYRRDTSITSLTCDGNYVYAIKGISEGTWPHFYTRIFKFDLNGNEVGSWHSPDSESFFCIGYSPLTGQLYCSAIRTDPGVGTYHDLRLYRMTTQGVVLAYRDLDSLTDTNVWPNLLTVGNDRVYMVRTHFITGNNEDTVAMYDLKTLNELGRFRSGEGGPNGNITTAQSLTADKDELYVMNKSYLSSTQIMYWVHVFTPDGQSVRVCSLSGTWETGHPFRTVAVYPSIIGGRIRPAPPANWIAENVPSGIQLDWPFVCRPGLVNAVAGYHVYRSLDVPEPNYQRITTDLVTDTFYVDKTVQGGQRYAYYLTVTDDQGCESDSSRSIRITAFPSSATGGATAYNNAPKILRDGYGVLHAAYSDTSGPSYITSSDGGINWTVPVLLGAGQLPGLALDEHDSLYAAWIRPSNYEHDWTDTLTHLFFSLKDSSGRWLAPCTLATDWSAVSPQVWYAPPCLAVVQDTARVVYESNRFTLGVPPGSWHLLWKLWYGKVPVHNPQAATWRVLDTLYQDQVWTPPPPSPASPSVSVFQGLGHVVYSKQEKVYYLEQTNETTWQPPVELSQSGALPSLHPTSTLFGNHLGVAWTLMSDTASGSPSAICYRRLNLGVDTAWGVRETLSLGLQYATQAELSNGPSTVFSAGNGGPYDIYLNDRDSSGWKLAENISNTPLVGSNFPHLFTVQESTSRAMDILWTEGDGVPYTVVYKGLSRDSLLPGPWLEADVGKAKASPFTVQRDGYLAYGSLPYQTIDYGHQKLVYRFSGLDASASYRLMLVAYFDKNKAVSTAAKAKQLQGAGVNASLPNGSLVVDPVNGSDPPKIKQTVLLNGVEVGTMDLVSGRPDTFILVIPKTLFQGGTIQLVLDKKNGRFASLSELFLYRWMDQRKKLFSSRGGGPQSLGSVELLPRVYDLSQSYPNPAREGLRINYALPKESQVSLKIYNVMGQLVITLKEGMEKPGYYTASWDGKDQQGHRVSSGVYLYRMQAGEFAKTRKLIVVR